MPEENTRAEELACEEETRTKEITDEQVVEETVSGNDSAEKEPVEKEIPAGEEMQKEKAVQKEEQTGEAVQENEQAEKSVQEERQSVAAVQKEEQLEEAVRDKEHPGEKAHGEEAKAAAEPVQEETFGEMSQEEEESAEEIIYTEGEGMEEMEEQDYRTDEENKINLDYFEEEPKKRSFFRRNREEAHFLRDKWILSRIRDEDLMEYLVLEQKRNEQLQQARDIREKRIISAFKLTVSLAAGVAVVYLLKDNPTIFVNILYIGGILGGFWFWKNTKEK